MKGKIFLLIVFSILLVVSISQIFTIPPYKEKIFPVYKSGYFNELEKSSRVISKGFFTLMATGNRSLPWIFLSDMKSQLDIEAKLFDSRGRYVMFPEKKMKTDKSVNAFIPGTFEEKGMVSGSRYYHYMKIRARKKCIICHRNRKTGEKMGAFIINHPINGFIYYSSERIILFTVLSIFIASILFFIIKWDPEKNIKELFDKYE